MLKGAKTKRKINRNRKRITPHKIQLSSLTFLITLSHSLNIGKRTQRKTIIQTLSIYTNIISKKTRYVMKEIIRNKKSHQCTSVQFYHSEGQKNI